MTRMETDLDECTEVTSAKNICVCGARLSTVRELSDAVLFADRLDTGGSNDAVFYFENLCGVYRSTVFAVARSARDVAYRSRGAQLLHDRLFESCKLDQAGTDAGHTRKRAADTDKFADGHRLQLGVGFSRDDVLLVSISFLRESFLWR